MKANLFNTTKIVFMIFFSFFLLIQVATFHNTILEILGPIIMFSGIFLNLLAVLYNGLKMPMYAKGIGTTQRRKRVMHKIIRKKSQARLFYLCDIIRIPLYKKGKETMYLFISIGDIILTIGCMIILIF